MHMQRWVGGVGMTSVDVISEMVKTDYFYARDLIGIDLLIVKLYFNNVMPYSYQVDYRLFMDAQNTVHSHIAHMRGKW